MSRYRILPTLTVVMVLIVLGASPALAGETVKTKATGTSINTKWHHIDVGDTEGHVVAVYQNTQVWISEINGERVTAFSRGIMDLNKKSGQGTMRGYSVMTGEDGEKRFSSYDGKMVGKGQWEGTYTYTGGTGKYDGSSGGGTWKGKSLGPGISHVEAEGERTFKSE